MGTWLIKLHWDFGVGWVLVTSLGVHIVLFHKHFGLPWWLQGGKVHGPRHCRLRRGMGARVAMGPSLGNMLSGGHHRG